VEIEPSSCPSGQLHWALVNSSGTTMASQDWCTNQKVTGLAAGTYTWKVTPQGLHSGTYSASVYVVPPAQQFSVSLPLSASNGVPSSGAGNLETTSSEDDYTFTIPTAGDVQVTPSSCPSSQLHWQLVRQSTGISVATQDWCFGGQLVSGLSADTYVLKVSPQSLRSGTYSLAVSFLAAPQTFSVSLPLSASNGVPAAGAGNLEAASSEDRYSFTLASAGDVLVTPSSCPNAGVSLHWALVNASGTTLASQDNCAASRVTGLSTGTYTVKVSPQASQTGTYALSVVFYPTPDQFTVSLPMSASNGTPGTGAGNLETATSEDRYTFTTSAAGDLRITPSSCPNSGASLVWALTGQSGTIATAQDCTGQLVTALAAGTYTVKVTSQNSQSGTYALSVFVGQPPVVRDGQGAQDIAVSTSSTLYANWTAPSAPSGIASYSFCMGTAVTSQLACAGTVVQPLANVGTSTSASMSGVAVAQGETYFTCVWATDNQSNVSKACSDGQSVELVAPARDGTSTVDDADYQPSASSLSFNWNVASPSSGLSYDWQVCAATPCLTALASGNTTATSITATGLSLADGVRYFACYRAVDGTYTSPYVCSNGVRVDTDTPTMSTPDDGSGSIDIDAQSSGDLLRAHWAAATDTDPGSGVATYGWRFCTTTSCSTVLASGSTSTRTVSTTLSTRSERLHDGLQLRACGRRCGQCLRVRVLGRFRNRRDRHERIEHDQQRHDLERRREPLHHRRVHRDHC